jgi:hypothetical protein
MIPKVDADGKVELIDLRPIAEQDDSCVFQATPKQRELFMSRARFRAAIGGRGSGKSQFLLWEAVRYLVRYPGCHVLLIRKDFKELSKGLIQDLLTDVPSDLYKYNGSDHIATWNNGPDVPSSKLFFGHCENLRIEDLNQYLSASFSFIGMDEGGEFPFVIWDFLLGSNRNKVEGPRPTMALATNPYGIGYGWIKKLFIDKQPVAQLEESKSYDPENYFYNHSTLLHNPYLMRKDPDYINRLNLLSPELRKKMLDGDLNSVTGQYYGNFSMARHVINLRDDPDRIKWESWQKPWCGSDYGLAHWWVTYWMRLAMVRRWNGEWKRACVVYKELIDHEKSIEQYTKLLAQKNAGDEVRYIFFSPERFNRIDPQNTPAAQFETELLKYNMPRVSRASNARVAGATFIYSLLNSDELVFTDNCTGIINALPTLIRSELDLEDVQKAETLEDDCYDTLRYGVVSLLHPTEKPEEIRHQEKLATLPDLQSKMQYNFERMNRQDESNKAIKPKIVPRWMIGR